MDGGPLPGHVARRGMKVALRVHDLGGQDSFQPMEEGVRPAAAELADPPEDVGVHLLEQVVGLDFRLKRAREPPLRHGLQSAVVKQEELLDGEGISGSGAGQPDIHGRLLAGHSGRILSGNGSSCPARLSHRAAWFDADRPSEPTSSGAAAECGLLVRRHDRARSFETFIVQEPYGESDEERDRRLGEAIDAYLYDLERGACIDIEEWCRRYPDLAGELRELIRAVPFVRRAFELGATPAPAGRGVERAGDEASPPWSSVPVIDGGGPRGYLSLQEIGRGGMGVVFRATQQHTHRIVALKFLASGAAASSAARRRFEREIELAAGLDHPGIVRVLEAGEWANQLYFAMDFVDGEPLQDYLARESLGLRAKLDLFLEIVDAVQFAHQRGVIHRDLKPSNILVTRESHAQVLDFGLAQFARDYENKDALRVTQEGQLLGTLAYLSPEQAAGSHRDLDTRSDLYALGVILFEMLTGQLPYDTTGPLVAVLHHIGHTDPCRPSQFCREIGADLDAVVLKALEKPKDARYQTAAQLGEDVRCYLRNEPVEANRTTRFYLLRKAYARHRRQVQAVAAGFVLIVVAALVILAFYLQVRSERAQLRQQLHVSTLRRGLAHLASGHDMLAENVLRSAYRQTPDPQAYWSLLSFFVQNPLAGRISKAGWVTSLDYSSDGKSLAFGNLKGTLEVWATRDSESALWSAEAHSGQVQWLGFSTDGAIVASSGSDQRVKLWQTATGDLLHEFPDLLSGNVLVRFPPERNSILLLGQDGVLKRWDYQTDRSPRNVWTEPPMRAIVIADLSESTPMRLAMATSEGAIAVVEVESGTVNRFLRPQDSGPVSALRFNRDGRQLAVGSGGDIWLIDTTSGKRRWVGSAGLQEPRPTSLWDAAPAPHVCWTPSIEFSDDGELLAAAGWDAVVRLWTVTGEQSGELRAQSTAVYALTFQPGTRRLAAAAVGGIRVWDVSQHPIVMHRPLSPACGRTSVSVSSAAGLLAWTDATSPGTATTSLMHTISPYRTESLATQEARWSVLAFDASGRKLAAADDDGGVTVWDVAERQEALRWGQGRAGVRSLTFFPDGSRIATGDVSGRIEIRSAIDGSLEQGWPAHGGPVLAIAAAPDGKQLLSGGTDWRAVLWQVGNPNPQNEWRHLEWVNAVAFSPDGKLMATGSADLCLRIGPPAAAKPSIVIQVAHAHWVNAVAFLDQGQVLVSGGNDATARLWDVKSGDELSTIPSHWGAVYSLSASADDRFLAIGAERAVQLVDLGACADMIRRAEPRPAGR